VLVKRLIRFKLEETRISLGGKMVLLIASKSDAVTDFLIKLGIKPLMHLLEISILSL
jgi:hypothetical protein